MYHKILLVNSPRLSSSGRAQIFREHPPLGILYLAAYARKVYPDINLKIVDGHLTNSAKIYEEINSFNPDLIGVSYTTPAAPGAFKLAKEIRRTDPHVHLVAGGPHPSILPNESLLKGFDSVVVGEGEKAFLRIITEGSKGVIIGEPIRNLDEIPFPARDLVDLKEYPGDPIAKYRPEASYVSSRGCYWKPSCTFCSNPCGKDYRIRSPSNVVDEIESLINNYKMKEFFDQCDESTPNIKWMSSFNEEIKEAHFKACATSTAILHQKSIKKYTSHPSKAQNDSP